MAGLDLSGLNASQRDVALRLDEPLFVAAGAGSGKTFTLTARLVHALSQGSGADGGRYLDSLDQALVITFTKAAALEIKDRVRTTLAKAGVDDPHLAEESRRVDDAWISTIHGMCSRILKRHGMELGLDPAFTVVEGNVQETLRARAFDSVFAALQLDEDYRDLLDTFPLWGQGIDDANSIAGMVDRLCREASKCAAGFADLCCVESHETAEALARVMGAFDAMSSFSLSTKQQQVFDASMSALARWREAAPGARTPDFACEVLDAVKVPDLRKKDQREIKEDAKHALAEAYVIAQHERVQHFAPQLKEVAERVSEAYGALKLERSYLDSDDLIEMALAAVEGNAEVAADLRGRFRLVMIDEFQDTDAKQLRLISLLAGEGARHLTTVGDAQQAIYRFRGGDVEVFRSRGRTLDEASHVRMDVNYRSDHNVLALVERVCGDAGLIDDFLKLAGSAGRRGRYEVVGEGDEGPCRIFFEVATGAASELTAATLAAQVADRLRSIADAGQPVSTMALLLGRTKYVGYYLDALRARGLPAVVTGGSSFTTRAEVGCVQALLHTLANPQDTEAGLFRLLSSDMFRLDADDFVQLGTTRQPELDAPCKRPLEQAFLEDDLSLYDDAEPSARLRQAHRVLRDAFSRLGRWPLSDVCQQVIEESGWLRRLELAGDDGLAVAANVLAALRYVRDLTEGLGLSAARAAEEFDQWLRVTKLTPKSLAGDKVDAVQVMTIHGSKGLQFGVCAVAECWSNPAVKGRLSVGEMLGVHAVCVSPGLETEQQRRLSAAQKQLGPVGELTRRSNVAEWVAALREAELAADAAEKARLLYVALTRAEEALVVALPVAGGKQWRSKLALGLLDAFPELAELEAGTCEMDVEPARGIECEEREVTPAGDVVTVRRRRRVERGLTRVVSLIKGVDKDAPWQAYSKGTLAGFDGELPTSLTLVPSLGVSGDGEEEREGVPFTLFETDHRQVAAWGWREREGIYSHTSLDRERRAAERAAAGLAPVADSEDVREAEAEGAPYTKDADRATALGSAFHAVAETMVKRGADHDEAHVAELCAIWHLSERQRARLDAAIACWEASEVRAEALAFPVVRAEVPFFLPTPGSAAGAYVEGSIDLLATESRAPAGEAFVVDYKTGDIGMGEEEVRSRHETQAELYAHVLLAQGFEYVRLAFVCVETGVVARYEYGPADVGPWVIAAPAVEQVG